MAEIKIPKPLASGSLEEPDAPQPDHNDDGGVALPEGFTTSASSSKLDPKEGVQLPEGFHTRPAPEKEPEQGTLSKVDDKINDTLAPNPENYGSFAATNAIEVPKTLGREVYQGAKSILGSAKGLYNAFADPETDEERDVNQRQGIDPGLGSRLSTGLGRITVDPVANAIKTYADPKTRPTADQALSVLPEAIGEGAGAVVGGKLADHALGYGKRVLGSAIDNATSIKSVSPKLTKQAIEAGRANPLPTKVTPQAPIDPLESALSEGRANKIPSKVTPLGSALDTAIEEGRASKIPTNSRPIDPLKEAVDQGNASRIPNKLKPEPVAKTPLQSALEEGRASKLSTTVKSPSDLAIAEGRASKVPTKIKPLGSAMADTEITPEQIETSRSNVAEKTKAEEPTQAATETKEPEYKWPSFDIDNKANALAKEELGLTDTKDLSKEQLDQLATRGQEIKTKLRTEQAAATDKGYEHLQNAIDQSPKDAPFSDVLDKANKLHEDSSGKPAAEEAPKEEPYTGEERRAQDAKDYTGEERRKSRPVGATETAEKLKNGEVFHNVVDETPGAMDTINKDLASRSVSRTGKGVEPTPAKLAEQKPGKAPVEAEPKEATEAEPEAKSEETEEPAVENATSNKGVIDHLTEKAKTMEDSNEDPFRTRAFRNAAEAIKNLPEGQSIEDLIKNPKELAKVPGIGKSVASYLQDTFKTEGAKTLASSASEEHLGDLSNDELKEQGKKYGLNPEDYDFKKREALRPGGSKHPVERRQFVRDLLDAMPEGDRVKLNKLAEDASKNAGIFSDKDMSSLGKAARAREVFSALGKKE